MGPKVLLVHPKLEASFFSDIRLPPLGLAYLAGALRAAGYSAVRILDANIVRDPEAELERVLAADLPDFVGLSVTTPVFRAAQRYSRLVRSRLPKATIVWGGVHPTVLPRETAAEEAVDYVVLGEGERTIVELVRALELGGSPDGIPGIAFRKAGGIAVSARPPFLEDLDKLPLPAYDLLKLRSYSNPQSAHSPLGMMITSRGCPHSCIFCVNQAVLGKKYRMYSPARMIAEVRLLIRDFGVREIMFKESDFTLDHSRVREFCELLLGEPRKISWSCNGHLGLTDRELLRTMRRAGCRLIQYGVESGDERVLKTLKKGTSEALAAETFRLTRDAGIKTVANLMIGNPGDTRESIARTIALPRTLRADMANFQFCAPFPGTELHHLAATNGWFLPGRDAFCLRTDSCSMNATNIPTPELEGMLRKAYRSFYLRPGYILRRALSPHAEDWRANVRGFLRVMGVS